MALVTTVATTPLTSALYPPWYQKKLEAWKKGEIDWDGNQLFPEQDSEQTSLEKLQNSPIRRLLVHLRLDSLPSLFTFINLLGGDTQQISNPVRVHGMRMLELTERTSSVMQVSETDENTYNDPVVNAFRTFAQLHYVAVSGSVSIVSAASYAKTITEKASDMSSDLVVIPWSETGTVSESYESHFSIDNYSQDRFRNEPQNTFIRNVLDSTKCNALIFINRGLDGNPPVDVRSLKRTTSGLSIYHEVVVSPATNLKRHVYFPFFGGSDDRFALRFVLQLAQNPTITVTVMHVNAPTQANTQTQISSRPPEVMGEAGTTEHAVEGSKIGSDATTDGGTDGSAAQDDTFLYSLRDSLPAALAARVSFLSNDSTSNIGSWFSNTDRGEEAPKIGDLIVVGRRKGIEHPVTQHLPSMGTGIEVRKTLGAAAECLILTGVKASILVLQASV
jgi:hypothetical protein